MDDEDKKDQLDPDETGGPEGSNGDENEGGDGQDPRIQDLNREAARHRHEKKEIQRQLDEANQRLREIEDKDKSELTKATERAAELETENAQLKTGLTQAQVKIAFLASNKYEWHNADRALALVDLSEVTIDEDGKVTGLDKALEALVKSDPYLVKATDGSSDSGPKGSSGAPAGSGKKDKDGANREKLISRYPVLRR